MKIVCLCGSTKFKKEFEEWNKIETMQGNIVLAPGVFIHSGDDCCEAVKDRLDELHLRKIDMSDEVLVINPAGYIGESTRDEIAYAERHDKILRYVEN